MNMDINNNKVVFFIIKTSNYVNVMDVYARGVSVNLTPLTSKRGALATDVRGCSLWRYLLECPPPACKSRVRDPLGTIYEFERCGPGRGCYINDINKIILISTTLFFSISSEFDRNYGTVFVIVCNPFFVQ